MSEDPDDDLARTKALRRRHRAPRSRLTEGVRSVAKKQGWDGEVFRALSVKYNACPAKADRQKVVEEFLAMATHLCDTVIKQCYPGVPEDRFEDMHSRALEKCWKGLVSGVLHTWDQPGARLYTNVKNVLIDYWRGELGRKLRHAVSGDVVIERPSGRNFDPVVSAEYHEMRESMASLLARKGQEYRWRWHYGDAYKEFTEFYLRMHRTPQQCELTSLTLLRAGRIVYQTVAYHFRKSLAQVMEGERPSF